MTQTSEGVTSAVGDSVTRIEPEIMGRHARFRWDRCSCPVPLRLLGQRL